MNLSSRFRAMPAIGFAFIGLGLMGDAASLAVGRTDAAYGVTAAGAARYSIPIRVTDGIGGMTPALSIDYVGPGQRTVLGIGFAIGGLSTIDPCRRTIAQDLNAAPVTLTSADRYCLDGARLRLASGTYGGTGTTYRTELDQMARVTSWDSTSNIPGWFKVETRDGLTYEYGNSSDSKLLSSSYSGSPPEFWAVSKISDRAGNFITFSYETDNTARRFRPSYILYTARTGVAAKYKISFVYQSTDRPDSTLDITPSASGSATHYEYRLLERIELLHDGIVYRKYLLGYETGAGSNSRLKTVQECATLPSEVCLPATNLTWQSATIGHDGAVSSSVIGNTVFALDINGDGIEDVAYAASGKWNYMLGSATGFQTPVNTNVTVTNIGRAMVLEWNGDGFKDLLIDWSDGKWRVLRGSSTGFNTTVVHAGPGTGVPSNTANSAWTVADANSDGRDDLLRMTTNFAPIAIKLRLNGATGFGSETLAYSDTYIFGWSTGFGIGWQTRPDINGDGRTELLVYGCEYDYESQTCLSYGWYLLVSNGSSYFNGGNLIDGSLAVNAQVGDFNNDGLSDLIYPGQSAGAWYIGYGQGGGWLLLGSGPNFSGYSTWLTMTGDYNGDGYDDFYAAHTSSGTWHVFLNVGTGLATTPTATGISSAGGGWTLADFNGDSLQDFGRYDTSSYMWSTYRHLGLPGERLASAVDGLENGVAFAYLPMSSSTVYSKGTGAVYPKRDFQSALPLVRTMQVFPGGGTSYSIEYKYSGARMDNQGRSFLGMESRTVTEVHDGIPGIFTTETYSQVFPYIGAPLTVTAKQPGGAYTIQSATHSYLHHVLDATSGNQRYLPYRSQSLVNIHEVSGSKNGNLITEITETNTVNTLGNTTVASIVTVDKDLGSSEYGQSYTTAIAATYSQDQTNWCLAVPTSRSETRTLPGSVTETRAVSWVVASLECRVIQETIEPNAGSTLSLVTDLGYDGCGNMNSISAYSAGLPAQARTTTIGYGTRCQRPESITNPLNQTSIISYDWSLGLPSTQTDPNSIAISFEYDGFGRLTRQLRPDGTAAQFLLTACNAGNGWCGKNSSARVKVTRTERDSLDSVLRTDEQFLDGFGRVRWSHSDSLESGPAIVEILYDAFGQPSQQTQPYFAAGTVYATTYLRDLVGRVTQINAPIDEANPNGRITGFAYEGRDFKITDPRNFTTTRRSNAIGGLRAVVDPSPGGTTNYAYRPFGEIASITDAANNASTWSYNLRGFVTGTGDPDAGSWTYVPNAFGELTSQTDAKSQVLQYTYDQLSRPLTRVEAEGTTTWTWGTSAAAKNIGRLASISSPGSYSEAYSFDPQGRLIQQSVTADAATYYINLSYNTLTGLLDTLQYPTSTAGYRLKLAYDYSSNLLQKVRDFNGSTIFWQATSTDAFGHIQDETFGNGVQTFTDFDQASGLMSAREGGMGGGTGLIHSQVAWDLNHNLEQRQDLQLSPTVTEDLFYDSLNRLDRSNRNSFENLNVDLDAIGNITSKGGLAYTYTGAQTGCSYYAHTQPRAVRKIGAATIYCYDANGNMTKRDGSNIGYTSYNLPNVINAGSSSSTISYGAFRNRYQQVAVASGSTETTLYVAGLLEKMTRSGVTEYRHLIKGGKGTAAIYTRRSDATNSTYYVHSDHLGSPELITESSGTERVRLSFAAYGERRDRDWDGPVTAADLATIGNTIRHGFTDHEHLDSVSLIHMNGRVYDPVAGRFLGRDPFIDGIASSQGPNGYAYVHNNPLTMIDPSGFQCIPPEGVSDEEAQDYLTRCDAAYESSGWGPANGENSKWCTELGIGCRLSLSDPVNFGVAGGSASGWGDVPLSPFTQMALDSYEAMVGRTIREARFGPSSVDVQYGDVVVTANRETGAETIDFSRTSRGYLGQWRLLGEITGFNTSGRVTSGPGPVRVTAFDTGPSMHAQQFEFEVTVRPSDYNGLWVSPVYGATVGTGGYGTLGSQLFYTGDPSYSSWTWTFTILPGHQNCGNCGKPGLLIHEYTE